MNDKEPQRLVTVGGEMLRAIDTALEDAWNDDRLVEALAHDEGLIEVYTNLELAVETLRSALLTIERPDPRGLSSGERE